MKYCFVISFLIFVTNNISVYFFVQKSILDTSVIFPSWLLIILIFYRSHYVFFKVFTIMFIRQMKALLNLNSLKNPMPGAGLKSVR